MQVAADFGVETHRLFQYNWCMENVQLKRPVRFRFTLLLLFLAVFELAAVGLSSASFYSRAYSWNLLLGADIPLVSRSIIKLAYLLKMSNPLLYILMLGLVVFEFTYKKAFTRIIVYTYIMLLLAVYFSMLIIAGFPPVWIV